MAYDHAYIKRLHRKLVDGVNKDLDYVVFNGDPENTYEGWWQVAFTPWQPTINDDAFSQAA